MDIVELIVYAAVCLMVGGCIGYVLGRESPRRCADCLSNDANRYAAGYKEGCRIGVEMTMERVRMVGHYGRGQRGEYVWIIDKDELERIRAEAECV